jgi:AcrR family transcriptional regulator
VTPQPIRPDLLAGEDLLPLPRQKRSRRKRADLLRAGRHLFAEKGFEAASVEEIAGRAHMAVGSFYQHFRSKTQLLLALMDELLEKLSAITLKLATGEARAGILEMLRTGFETEAAYAGAYRAWKESVPGNAMLAIKDQAIRRWTTARLTLALAFMQKLPHARPGVNAPVLANLLDHFFWELLGQPLEHGAESLEAVTDLVYHSMFVDVD